MDTKTYQILQRMADTTHQENRSEDNDYIERFSSEPSQSMIWIRTVIGKIRKAKRRVPVYNEGRQKVKKIPELNSR